MNKFLPLAAFVVLAGFLYIGLGLDNKKLPSPLINQPFPNLQVEDFRTGELSSMDEILKGKISLVNVWASWCVTCRAEHQMIKQIAKNTGVQMVGINYKDTKKEARRYLSILGDPYQTIVFDQQGKLGLELGVYATPETFLVDKSGMIREKRIGEMTKNIWESRFLPLVTQLK